MVQIGIHKLLCALIYVFPFYRHLKIRFIGGAETHFILKSRLERTLCSHSAWILSCCHHNVGLGVLRAELYLRVLVWLNTISGQKTK